MYYMTEKKRYNWSTSVTEKIKDTVYSDSRFHSLAPVFDQTIESKVKLYGDYRLDERYIRLWTRGVTEFNIWPTECSADEDVEECSIEKYVESA